MRKAIYCLFFWILFFCAQIHSQEIKNLNIVINASPPVTNSIKDYLVKNPKIVLSKSGVEYYIQVVKPKKSIEYKILEIEGDPNTDYKLRIINPIKNEADITINAEITEELQSLFKKKIKIEEKEK